MNGQLSREQPGVNPGRPAGSPEMAAIARTRAAKTPNANMELIEAPVEDAALSRRADALLFCYTHDVLQNPRALVNLFAAAKRCRN